MFYSEEEIARIVNRAISFIKNPLNSNEKKKEKLLTKLKEVLNQLKMSGVDRDIKQCEKDSTASDCSRLSYSEVTEEARQIAENSNAEIEFEEKPRTSRSDRGCFVQAWIWVPYWEKD